MLKCARCGQGFPTFEEFQSHKAYGHPAPLNVTGRTKAQIVKAMEIRLAPHIIDGTNGHTHPCDCRQCIDNDWQEYLRQHRA